MEVGGFIGKVTRWNHGNSLVVHPQLSSYNGFPLDGALMDGASHKPPVHVFINFGDKLSFILSLPFPERIHYYYIQ